VTILITREATFRITRGVLNAFCAARGAGPVVIPPPGNDKGIFIHCSGQPTSISGFNMTTVCRVVARDLGLSGHWVDLGNENNPQLWQCQKQKA
jgi:hypothetical protein